MAGFTIDSVSYSEVFQTQMLQGSKDALIETIYVDGYSGVTLYPTPLSWKTELQLSPGENTVEVYGVDTVGNITPTQTITVTLRSQLLTPDNTFNTFDNFGLLLGLERLPGEKNLNYRNRLVDVALHKPSSTKLGMSNAISRELGVKPYYESVSIVAGKNTQGELLDPTASFEITNTGLFFYADSMITEEVLHLDPGFMVLDLQQFPRSVEDITIQTYNGHPVDSNNYTVDITNKQIRIINEEYGREWLRVRYCYATYICTYDLTVQGLKDALDAFTVGGNPYLNMTITDPDVAGLSARNIENVSYMPVPYTELPLTVYKMSIFELWDPLFKDMFINSDGHAYGTKLEGWAKEISSQASITWGQCILDRDHWDITNNRRLLDTLPHLWDNQCTRWYSEDDLRRYTCRESLFYGRHTKCGQFKLIRKGVQADGFKSGIGQNNDLLMADVTEVV